MLEPLVGAFAEGSAGARVTPMSRLHFARKELRMATILPSRPGCLRVSRLEKQKGAQSCALLFVVATIMCVLEEGDDAPRLVLCLGRTLHVGYCYERTCRAVGLPLTLFCFAAIHGCCCCCYNRVTEVMKGIAAKWRELSETDKEEWTAKAAQDKDR